MRDPREIIKKLTFGMHSCTSDFLMLYFYFVDKYLEMIERFFKLFSFRKT